MAGDQIVGYVIGVRKYAENDAIINVFTEAGVKSIYGKGYKKITSKYHVLNNLFLKVKLYGTDKNFFRVSDFEIIEYPTLTYDDYEFIERIYKVLELIIRTTKELGILQRKYLYDKFEEFVNIIDKENYDSVYFWYLTKILQVHHINLNFSECVICGRQEEFYGLSLIGGGIVCKNCNMEEFEQNLFFREIKEIKMINMLFNGKIESMQDKKIEPRIKQGILSLLNEGVGVYNKE